MKIDPDILSIHRGLPSSEEELVCEAPSLEPTRNLTGSGGPAPSSHQFWRVTFRWCPSPDSGGVVRVTREEGEEMTGDIP